MTMKRFKLLCDQEFLSTSLNNSDPLNTVDSDKYKEDSAARGLAIITSTKNGKAFKTDVFKNMVKNVKEKKSLKPPKMKPKRPDVINNLGEKSFSNSISDLTIPKNVSKINKATSQTDQSRATSSDVNSKKYQNFDDNVVLIPTEADNNLSSEDLFKTPKFINKNIRSMISPVFTSSPIIPTRVGANSDKVDFFATEIMGTINNNAYKSSLRSNMPSPILKETRTVSFHSNLSGKDLFENEIRETASLEMSKVKETSITNKSPSNSIDEETDSLKPKRTNKKRKSSSSISNGSVVQKNAAKMKKSPEVIPSNNEAEVNKKKQKNKIQTISSTRSCNDTSDSKKEAKLKKSPKSISSTKATETVIEIPSKGKDIVSPENNIKTQKTTTRGSLNSLILPSTTVIPIKDRKARENTNISAPEINVSRVKKVRSKLPLDGVTISPIKRKTKSLSNKRLSQPYDAGRKTAIKNRQSAPLETKKPIVTRYGRVIRSFAESELGKYIIERYLSNSK